MKNKRQIFFKGGDKTKILYECDCDDTPTPSFAKIKKPISNPSSNVRDKLRPENQIEFVLDKNEFATKTPFQPILPVPKGKEHLVMGGKSNASKYKKYLQNLTLKKLQKIARSKHVKITRKKHGKTVHCKKLYQKKYGK